MSTIPSRTRSLRTPAAETGNRYGRSSATESNDADSMAARPAAAERSSHSPSRLPVKPTRSTSTTTARPPSASGSISSSTSMRPPPSRANISKPTTGGLQRSSSGRRANPPAGNELDADPVKKDRSRPPLTQSRHLRNASASSLSSSSRISSHSRTKSSSTTLSASTALRPPSATQERTSAPAPTEPQLRRPAFSTLQQHFSPAKSLAPKPHPAAFFAPPSPSKLPSNIAISAETAKLQNELLQLHLMHKDAGVVNSQWRASAKRKLGSRFRSVVESNKDLVDLEVEETGKINAAALKKWKDLGAPGWGLEEKIQVLDEVVTGVWNLGDSGGKYARLVRKFERWLSRCQDVLESRADNEKLEDNEVVFVEELDSGWKDDCLLLSRKLETWKGHLKDLASPDVGSSLAVVLDGCQSLVVGMLQELTLMARIERAAISMETEWIKSMNNDVLDDEDIAVAGAIWRSR